MWLFWIGWFPWCVAALDWLASSLHISDGLAGLAEFPFAAGGWFLQNDWLTPSRPACFWIHWLGNSCMVHANLVGGSSMVFFRQFLQCVGAFDWLPLLG